MIGVLGSLETQEEVPESETGDDKGGSSNVLTAVAKENKEEDEPKNKQVEQAPEGVRGGTNNKFLLKGASKEPYPQGPLANSSSY